MKLLALATALTAITAFVPPTNAFSTCPWTHESTLSYDEVVAKLVQIVERRLQLPRPDCKHQTFSSGRTDFQTATAVHHSRSAMPLNCWTSYTFRGRTSSTTPSLTTSISALITWSLFVGPSMPPSVDLQLRKWRQSASLHAKSEVLMRRGHQWTLQRLASRVQRD